MEGQILININIYSRGLKKQFGCFWIISLVILLVLLPEGLPLDIASCLDDLGFENGLVKDEAFSASSSHDPTNVGPKNARLHNDKNGGAWCPKEPISRENSDQWLQINLTTTQVISVVMTQGRFANGQGQEYTQAYQIQYWRKGMKHFKSYHDSFGRMVVPGNKDTYSIASSHLNPPIVATAIRILPYSNHSRTVCLRIGLRGCNFTEGVESYNIPQGMVRGSTLELLDITYDGAEDPITGFLRGGIGQLVDGKYGSENFKATGDNGLAKGYEWIGWKNKSMGPLQMDFTFDKIRKFKQMAIHINNHYTKDIQIFSRARIYFSNEEGKFDDDRSVDYFYMPDQMLEDARNVTINLNGEHGKYVKVQLYFAAKWILISEITFQSDIYEETTFSTVEVKNIEITTENVKPKDEYNEKVKVEQEEEKVDITITNIGKKSHVPISQSEDDSEGTNSKYIGLLIGVLLTMISLLLAGIFFVVYRGRQGKNTPTHSILAAKFHDKITASIDFKDMAAGYTPYKAKMRVYGQVPAVETMGLNGNLYTNPSITNGVYSSYAGLPTNLNKKFSSDPVLSDCTDDYAEPQLNQVGQTQQTSTSYSDNIYSQAFPQTSQTQSVKSSNQVNQYAIPKSPVSSPDYQPFLQHSSSRSKYSPPQQKIPSDKYISRQRNSPPKTLNLHNVYNGSCRGKSSSKQLNDNIDNFSNKKDEIFSPSQSSFSSVDKIYMGSNFNNMTNSKISLGPHYSKVENAKRSKAGRSYEKSWSSDSQSDQMKNTLSQSDPAPPFTLPKLIKRSQLKIIEKIGRGKYGEVHLCHLLDSSQICLLSSTSNILTSTSSLVAVKSLDTDCTPILRGDFQSEANSLSGVTDANITRVLGMNMEANSNWFLVSEYSDQGDLNQYLQDHVAESSLSKSPGIATLSYGSLIYMATQIASGMKCLESINYVHRDMATRNCLVYPGFHVKISDCGAARSLYKGDYYHLTEEGDLPIRWMAWESVLMGVYTSKSDVWSFGVALWEILTFAREQPYEDLSDDKVIENISHMYENGSLLHTLQQPYNCPRDVFDLISECWHKKESERPNFREIHLFLQRKNLGFNPDTE